MKLTNQVAAVVITSVLALFGLVVGLAVLADWSDGAIVGMVTALGGLMINTILIMRGQQQASHQLEKIQENTNGSLSQRDDNIAALQAENRRLSSVISQLRARP